MIDLRVQFGKDHDNEARRMLRRLARKTSNLTGGLKAIGEALREVARDRFDSQTDPDGRPWAPLRPLTVETRGGSSSPILTRSGALKRSISYQVSGATLRLGPNMIYDAAQQYGATILPKRSSHLMVPLPGGGRVPLKKAVLPARRYIGFGAADQKATRETIEEWLDLEKG